jgi:starch-binding outer membrane protein, SusD/RagB family
MKMQSRCLAFLLGVVLLAGCDLEQNPVATSGKSAVFGTERGLELYANSFYNWMPNADNITRADAMSDYAARRDVPSFIRPGVYNSRVTDNTSASAYELVAIGGDWSWGWGSLRNINYFLANNIDPAISEDVRNHYNGIARFFRAWFYFEKVKRYGDVPWIDKPLDVSDEKLYGPRDSRALVMDRVMEDLNYAIANIRTVNEPSRTLITRDVALALKSRVALFEGTYRKYHPEAGLSQTSGAWLTEAAAASKALMDSGRYGLFTGAGADGSYRQVFIRDAPLASEVLLAVVSSTSLGVRHAANWWYTSATTGVRFSFLRPFIHTYLNLDGTPFTGRPDYATQTFAEEMKGRDRRLRQTVRAHDYKRTNAGAVVAAPPAFSYTYTGYHPIKWSVDDVAVDGGNNNTNAVSVFRYAEVLLNYAEARAELGTLTAAEWAQTVGTLRARAGITGGLTALPTAVDPYLQATYFPDISNPVILEVRRERSIELALEGFRFYDIVRWRRGALMEMPWTGIYVPQANQDLDLDEDGRADVHFFTVSAPANRQPGVLYIGVNGDHRLTGGTSGELVWRRDVARKWEPKNYLYPIPETHLLTNPNLKQNPGW